MASFGRDVCVIGGAGHVGLPLAITFADCGLKTVIYDLNSRHVQMIARGEMPFAENGAEPMLAKVLAAATLEVSDTPALLGDCKFVVLIIGTPVDEHLNPDFTAIHRAIDCCQSELRDGQILVLRSTVFPGISHHIQRYLHEKGLKIDVAFCPERVAQGNSLTEFRQLPQIVSAFDEGALEKVKGLFGKFTTEFVDMTPMEAELCKLMTNAWRYLQFATVNQFYMIATQHNLNFDRILFGCRHNYPRMAGMPGPGFAAGPCLVKDTMQLAAFSQNNFVLGHAAMLVNEGLPAHLIALAKQQTTLSDKVVGILGMAFKAESDDSRDSLSFKLLKLLVLEAKKVLYADPYVKCDGLSSQQDVIALSDVVFIGTPHKRYRELAIPADTLVIDVWSCTRRSANQ
ncbi:MAG TPA: nucleotide sugar dehydrogenase [Tepidisphaeraceae bacterium]|jgi:UDP-N-acetyl-D-mannosaminuronic acid dehydrogenase|nr:nucleotide sugar dehydrogenase [Tepidisphaeraceae bacterium]